MLEEMAQKKNASKNSVAIELILSGSTKRDADDALAERIAELVVDKLTDKLTMPAISSTARGVVVSNDGREMSHDETKIQADEPELLGEDALDYAFHLSFEANKKNGEKGVWTHRTHNL